MVENLMLESNRFPRAEMVRQSDFKDRGRGTAVVTGGRRGIGRAAAIELAQVGFDVVVLDVVEDEAATKTLQLLADYPVASAFLRCDLGAVEAHSAVIDQVVDEFGSITCLVNNAGVQVPVRGDLLDVSADVFDHVVGVNLRGTFFFMQEVAKRMIQKDGHLRSIVTITSSNASLVSPEKAPYCISKAALSMANSIFAVRLAAEDIPVFEIRPGLIKTDMTEIVRDQYSIAIDNGVSPVSRWGEPEDVARVIANLATGVLPFTTGEIINVGGGIHIARL